MATATFPIPSTPVPAGTRTWQLPINPGDYMHYSIGLDLTGILAGTSVSGLMQFSIDNGATWVRGAGFTSVGGIGPAPGMDGTMVLPGCGADFPFPNQACLARAEFTTPVAGTVSGNLTLS